MQTDRRTTIKSIAKRISLFRVDPAGNSSHPRPRASGVNARAFVSRRVASKCVASECVELPSVECTASSAMPVVSYRLDRSHVFACLKAVAAKSKVSRLLGRTAKRVSGLRRVPVSVEPASVENASVSVVSVRTREQVSLRRGRLH